MEINLDICVIIKRNNCIRICIEELIFQNINNKLLCYNL